MDGELGSETYTGIDLLNVFSAICPLIILNYDRERRFVYEFSLKKLKAGVFCFHG